VLGTYSERGFTVSSWQLTHVLKVDQLLKSWLTHRVTHNNFKRAVAAQEKLHLTVCSEIEFSRTEVSGLAQIRMIRSFHARL